MTRFGAVLVTSLALLALCAPALVQPAPRLIWNTTASTPIGLYALQPVGHLHALELVVARPPEPIARYLADGGFLPAGVPLLKHILALPGQTVCRVGDAISIDHTVVGTALDRDHLGRPLPRWSGCRRMRPGQVFLMNSAVLDSLDGRYFGPFPTHSIIARAVPIWTDAADDGRFVWRAVLH